MLDVHAYIADVDSNALDRAMKSVVAKQGKSVQGVADFRTALDDKSVDFMRGAAPNHWPTQATSHGCTASKPAKV